MAACNADKWRIELQTQRKLEVRPLSWTLLRVVGWAVWWRGDVTGELQLLHTRIEWCHLAMVVMVQMSSMWGGMGHRGGLHGWCLSVQRYAV